MTWLIIAGILVFSMALFPGGRVISARRPGKIDIDSIRISASGNVQPRGEKSK